MEIKLKKVNTPQEIHCLSLYLYASKVFHLKLKTFILQKDSKKIQLFNYVKHYSDMTIEIKESKKPLNYLTIQ